MRLGYENKLHDHLRENTLIYYQILSTHSLRKYIEISWENLWILGLKGLSVISSISAGRYPENATFMHVWV